MLLHIMTLAGYIRGDDTARRQADATSFALAGIRFFGASDADFEADPAHAGAVDEGGRGLFAKGLGFADAAEDLVVGCSAGCGGGEGVCVCWLGVVQG